MNSTFVLYLICAWAVVLLPLPDPGSLRHPAPVNLVPFQWWFDMLAAVEAGDGGWLTGYPAPDQALVPGEERTYNPDATDCVIFSYGNGMPMSLRAARAIEK